MKQIERIGLTLSGALVFAAIAACSADNDELVQPPIGFVQVFSDEFDGLEGSLPDPNTWTYDIGTGAPDLPGWGNNELQYYTDSTDNVALDGNGNLRITAREIPLDERDDFDGASFSSARIKTEGLFTQEYGRFEARIRMPTGRAFWPAFWMLGDDISDVGWPLAGEIDIVEFGGNRPEQVSGAVHGPGYNGGAAIFSPYSESVEIDGETINTRFDGGFHVYAVEWDPTRITWFVDGVGYFSVSSENAQSVAASNCDAGVISAANCRSFTARDRWPFDHPFFMILNVAVGGVYVNDLVPEPGDLPETMIVDYVRVFERVE